MIFLLVRKVGCRKKCNGESLLFIGAGAAAGVVAGEGQKKPEPVINRPAPQYWM